MKNIKIGLGLGALAVILGLAAQQSFAASTRYTFTARGIVTAINYENNTATIAGTWASNKGVADIVGHTLIYNVKGAKCYKIESGKKNRATITKTLAVGRTVSYTGLAKSDDTYRITSLVANESSFTIQGKLKDHDLGKKLLVIKVTKSTFNPAKYVNKDVALTYGTSMQFKNSTGKLDVNADEVDANNQKVKVDVVVENGNWIAKSLWNEYRGK